MVCTTGRGRGAGAGWGGVGGLDVSECTTSACVGGMRRGAGWVADGIFKREQNPMPGRGNPPAERPFLCFERTTKAGRSPLSAARARPRTQRGEELLRRRE